ncbi:MAG TPA: GreA/GreB family elongation factor [Negativicutes bacterium]|nr:GreA/GreB family elongation factor [Negativicutes bacterium]
MEGKIYYVTKGKLAELKKEYEALAALEHTKALGEEAPKMVESDDLNPDFVSFQDEMSALRSRIDELQDVLGNHAVIKNPPKEQREVVLVGATVHVDLGGKKDEFMIVGTLEANPEEGKISNESPVGKALLGKKIGDEVLVSSPINKKYKIKDIKYEVG